MRNRITLYRKLKDYLAIWNCDSRIILPHIKRNAVRWMPQLKNGYRRLTLREFLDAYCISKVAEVLPSFFARSKSK